MIFLKKNNKIPEGYKFYLIDELVFYKNFLNKKNSIINDIEKLTEKIYYKQLSIEDKILWENCKNIHKTLSKLYFNSREIFNLDEIGYTLNLSYKNKNLPLINSSHKNINYIYFTDVIDINKIDRNDFNSLRYLYNKIATIEKERKDFNVKIYKIIMNEINYWIDLEKYNIEWYKIILNKFDIYFYDEPEGKSLLKDKINQIKSYL